MKYGVLWFRWFGFNTVTGASEGGPGTSHWDRVDFRTLEGAADNRGLCEVKIWK